MKLSSKKLCYLNGSTKNIDINDSLEDLQVFLDLDYDIDRTTYAKGLFDYHVDIGFKQEKPIIKLEMIYEVHFVLDEIISDEEIVNEIVNYLHPNLMLIIHLYVEQSNMFITSES